MMRNASNFQVQEKIFLNAGAKKWSTLSSGGAAGQLTRGKGPHLKIIASSAHFR